MDNIHFTLPHLLPYQRNFNFVNGVRSIGKTYGTYYYFIKDCIENHTEFVTLCRTQDEKKNGFLQKAVSKVVQREYAKYEEDFKYTNDNMLLGDRIIGWCIALSEYVKIKKNAYPNIHWLLFDEYVIEENSGSRYVTGWSEPDLFLSIYHTIDREEDRVKCFCMANNISAYNPYHLHKAFRIPYTEVGQIWKSKNVLFENAPASVELQEEKSDCKFLEMIKDTTYGEMAVGGKYIYDSDELVEPVNLSDCSPLFTLYYQGARYGVWRHISNTKIYISNKFNPTYPTKIAVTLDDMTNDTVLANRLTNGKLQYFSIRFKMGYVRFINMELKKRFTEIIPYLL